MVLAKFRRLEFECVDGIIRTFYGCSVVGSIEFDERLTELQHALKEKPEDASAEELYKSDKWMQHLINQLLKLNGIEPRWVNWEMVSQLLFGRMADGKVIEGYLVTLNRPDQTPKAGGDGIKISDKAALIAAISTHCSSIEEAYRIASTVPAHELFKVLEQKNHLTKPPEQRAKEEEAKRFEEYKQRRQREWREKAG